MERTYNLQPNDSHKSFYGKATVVETDDGIFLVSYRTIVCGIDNSRKFYRFWPGYSATTMRHINAFLAAYWMPGGGKKWWDALPVEKYSDFNARKQPENAA